MTGPFVEVNCATVRGDAAMSTLFGHVRGSFTGAMRDRPGLLRAADGGVLFLDEIGELGTDEQAALLRAIEDKQFLPLGADREVRSDFQLIAGTNADLPAAVRRGRFREDLLARINLWTFRLPGLRERPEDIEPNLDHELANCAAVTGVRISMSQEARARFLAFATSAEAIWAGNFRDFNGALVRMATMAPGGRISHEVVQEEIQRLRAPGETHPAANRPAICSRRCWRRRRSTPSILSNASSSRKWCACAARRARCRTPAGGSSPRRGRGRPRPTTPIGCASTSRASAWNGVTLREMPARPRA